MSAVLFRNLTIFWIVKACYVFQSGSVFLVFSVILICVSVCKSPTLLWMYKSLPREFAQEVSHRAHHLVFLGKTFQFCLLTEILESLPEV